MSSRLAEGVSEAEVRRMLDSEEMEDVKQGRAGVHTTSQTTFLTAGFQLEAAQYVFLLIACRGISTHYVQAKDHGRP